MQIYDRLRIETVLIKEKVKEIQKVIKELDTKLKSAKILEIYAIHSKEGTLSEKDELQTKIEKLMEQHKI